MNPLQALRPTLWRAQATASEALRRRRHAASGSPAAGWFAQFSSVSLDQRDGRKRELALFRGATVRL